jgi:hypothetical protein
MFVAEEISLPKFNNDVFSQVNNNEKLKLSQLQSQTAINPPHCTTSVLQVLAHFLLQNSPASFALMA